MTKIQQELVREAIEPALKHAPKNQDFVNLFAQKLIGRFKQVLALDMEEAGDRLAVANAALMLPEVARLKQEEFGDYLAGLLKDAKTPDVVKHWAVKALAEYFPVRAFTDLFDKPGAKPDPKLVKKKARDVERVQALLDLIERKPFAGVTPDAERYLRRDAIRTLAKVPIPAVATFKAGKIEGPAVYGLLHVLAKPGGQGWTDTVRFTSVAGKNGLDPPPALAERLEAAIGVCNLHYDNPADPQGWYNPEVGLYLVGRFLADFVDAYRADFAAKYHVGKKAWIEPPALAWKTEADRLNKALDELEKNAKHHPAKAKVKSLVRLVRPSLDNISNRERILEAVDRGQLADLRPEQGSVFVLPKKVKAPKGPNFLD